MSGTRQAWFYGLLALTVVVSACGGGGYTKTDFVARADAICTSTLRQTRALTPPASTSQPGGALAAYLGQLVPLVQSEAHQLRALKRPRQGSGLRHADAYFAALAQIVANYRQLEAAAGAATRRRYRRRGDASGQPDRRPRRQLRAAIVRHPGRDLGRLRLGATVQLRSVYRLRKMPDDLSLGEAAAALGVSVDTLRRWDRKGRIKTTRDARNRRLVPTSRSSG